MGDLEQGTLSERARTFLAALKSACESAGFKTNAELALVAGQRWDARLTVKGPLGEFTVRLWTTWTYLEHDGDVCRLELEHNGSEMRVPAYRCTGIEEFQAELEYLLLLIERITKAERLVDALKAGTKPEWRATTREAFMRSLRGSSSAAPAKKGFVS